MRVKIQSKTGSKIVNLNRRKAIRERCLNCAGWSHNDVKNCEFQDCDLYPFRFGTERQNAQKRHSAIRNYCLHYCCVGNKHELYKCPSTDCSLYAYRKSYTDNSVKISPNKKEGHIQQDQGVLIDEGIS